MKKIIMALALAMPILFVSCDKNLLEIPNPNTFPTDIFWESPENAWEGLVACYSGLLFEGTYRQWYDLSLEMRADLYFNESAWRDYANYSKFNFTNYDWECIIYIWRDHYRAIYMCNNFLKYAPDIDMSGVENGEELKERYIAEAKFLRALFYFNMMTYYGTPPLILEPLEGTEKPSNSSPEEIYGQILKDLADETITHLPRKRDLPEAEYGRATIGAALMLRAKAHMQFHNWQDAANDLDVIISEHGDYELVDEYDDNFRKETEHNSESIFEICFSDVNTGDWSTYQTPNSPTGWLRAQYFAPRMVGGHSDCQPNLFYLNEFTDTVADGSVDPRKDKSLFWNPGQTLYGKNFRNDFGGSLGSDTQRENFWTVKYSTGYYRDFENSYSPINQRLFRYADALLMYAECLNELGQTDDAYQYIDQVRQRPSVMVVRLSDEKPGLTQAEMRKQIEHERIVELGSESWRWFDIYRYGYLDTEKGRQLLESHDYEFKSFVVGRHKYLPIPQREIDLNTNLHQNPNY